MDRTKMALASCLLLLAACAPALAYHITAQPEGTTGRTSADWVVDPLSPVLIVCESDGIGDPRNPRLAPSSGIGGLCTAGRQDYFVDNIANNVVWDGELLPPTTKGAAMAAGWTQLDVCDKTVAIRAFGPCDIATIGFTAEIGVYSCFVRTANAVFPPGVLGLTPTDHSVFYEELYAWWSYDGDGDYTPAEEAGYHGHVAVFPSPLGRRLSLVPQVMDGSVYVAANAPDPASDVPCDGSPVGGNGPVVLADSSPQPLSVPPVCAQAWDGAALQTFPCVTSCSQLGPGATGVVAVAFIDFTGPSLPADSVQGTLDCPGGSTVTNTCVDGSPSDVVLVPVLGWAAAACTAGTVPVSGGVPTCTRTGGNLPTGASTLWVVACPG